ncbi:MAG: membrane protein insertion efficiency factor YidD [Candidatus Omnitrophota bacterium]
MKRALIATIKAYRKLTSPLNRRSCRFHPSCSEYAMEALERYGTVRGSLMSAWRILRCNPFSRGGFDPVVKERQGSV